MYERIVAIRLISRRWFLFGMSEKTIILSTPKIAAALPTIPIFRAFSLR